MAKQPLSYTRSSEEALREIFARFGIVQTCIVNVDKRHAFVKMLTRVEAKRAKDGMEIFKSTDMQLRVSANASVRGSRNLITYRLDGVWALDPAIAATTRLASA